MIPWIIYWRQGIRPLLTYVTLQWHFITINWIKERPMFCVQFWNLPQLVVMGRRSFPHSIEWIVQFRNNSSECFSTFIFSFERVISFANVPDVWDPSAQLLSSFVDGSMTNTEIPPETSCNSVRSCFIAACSIMSSPQTNINNKIILKIKRKQKVVLHKIVPLKVFFAETCQWMDPTIQKVTRKSSCVNARGIPPAA